MNRSMIRRATILVSLLGAIAFQAPMVGATAAIAPPAPISADWPQFGAGPGHSGFNAGEKTLKVGNVVHLHQKLTFVSDVPVQAVVGGTIYGVTHTNLYAIDAASGVTKWISHGGRGYLNSPAVGGGRVFVGGFDGSLYAINAATGKLSWSRAVDVNPLFSSPTVAGNTVYVHGDNRADQTIWYALDVVTGAIRWQTAPSSGGALAAMPSVSGGRVIVPSGGFAHSLMALDAATGATVWTTPVSTAFSSNPTVILADGVAYFAAQDLFAVDIATGRLLWTRKAAPNGLAFEQFGAPVVAHGVVYSIESFFASNPVLHAMSAATGRDLWTVAGVARPPSIANGVIYLINDRLRALDAVTGALLWSGPTRVFGTPVVANGRLYMSGAPSPTTLRIAVYGL